MDISVECDLIYLSYTDIQILLEVTKFRRQQRLLRGVTCYSQPGFVWAPERGVSLYPHTHSSEDFCVMKSRVVFNIPGFISFPN